MDNGSFPADAILIAPNTWELPNGTIIREVVVSQALISEFIASRRSGLSRRTIESYKDTLRRFIGCHPNEFNQRLVSLHLGNSSLNHYRNLKVLLGWLVASGKLSGQPLFPKPHIERKILAVVVREDMPKLLEHCGCLRDKALITLLFESGLRLSEAQRIKSTDIDWHRKRIAVLVKGNRRAYAVFESPQLLAQWYDAHNTWELSVEGIKTMLARLTLASGIQANAHCFRRGFAVELTRRQLPTRTIQQLGHWLSPAMVAHYTEGLSFEVAEEAYHNNNN